MLAAEDEEDQDEETLELSAIHRYLTSDTAKPRYPWYYTINQRRGLRCKAKRFAAIYKIRSGILNLSDLFYTHDNSYLLVRSCPRVHKVEKDKLL